MKMTKRWLALLLAGLLALSAVMLAACDDDPDVDPDQDGEQVLDGSAITKNPTAYVTLGQYKGFTVPAYDVTVTDKEVSDIYSAMLLSPADYPEEWLKAYGEYGPADFLEYLKTQLTEQKNAEAKHSYLSEALDLIVQDATFTEMVQPEIDAYVTEVEDYYKSRAGEVSLKDFVEQTLGQNFSEFRAELKADAEESIKNQAVIYAIAEAEGLELTNSIYQECLSRYAKQYNMATWEIEEALTKDVMKQYAFRDMVCDFIVDNTIVE